MEKTGYWRLEVRRKQWNQEGKLMQVMNSRMALVIPRPALPARLSIPRIERPWEARQSHWLQGKAMPTSQ